MNKEYQSMLDQLIFDKNADGIELRYKCNDPDLGFRIVFTDQDDMDLFDFPFMEIDRPSVFNINDFWPEKDLPWITEFIITTAYKTEKESLAELTPDEFFPEIHNYVKGGREFLEALSNDVDILNSGAKLFTIVGALITLIVRTELAFGEDSGIGVISRMNTIKH